MSLSPEKSSKGAIGVFEPFTFLGIEMSNGLIRPSKESRDRILSKVQDAIDESQRGFACIMRGKDLKSEQTFLKTLKRIDGVLQGWGKHYKFCNDMETMKHIDDNISKLISGYIGRYSSTRDGLTELKKRDLFGFQQLRHVEFDSFNWPKALKS